MPLLADQLPADGPLYLGPPGRLGQRAPSEFLTPRYLAYTQGITSPGLLR